MSKKESQITRRKLLKDAALAGLGGAMMPLNGLTSPRSREEGRINRG